MLEHAFEIVVDGINHEAVSLMIYGMLYRFTKLKPHLLNLSVKGMDRYII